MYRRSNHNDWMVGEQLGTDYYLWNTRGAYLCPITCLAAAITRAPWERHPAEQYANAFLLNSCGRDPTGRYYLPTAAASMDTLDQTSYTERKEKHEPHDDP